jgi:quercetin dioxygenase-like cupin family protein
MASVKAQTVLERDAVRVDPQHYKVELENDRVRVVRISYRGREKSVMHQHPPGIGIFLTDARFRFTYPDGKAEDIQAKAGEFLWFGEPWEHLPENLADEKSEVLYVELKS